MTDVITAPNASIVDEFKGRLRGDLIRRGDAAYEGARYIFNAMIDRRPALIVRAANAADIISAVNFARDHHLRWPSAAEGTTLPGSLLATAASSSISVACAGSA
jgi:hypothetical protein